MSISGTEQTLNRHFKLVNKFKKTHNKSTHAFQIFHQIQPTFFIYSSNSTQGAQEPHTQLVLIEFLSLAKYSTKSCIFKKILYCFQLIYHSWSMFYSCGSNPTHPPLNAIFPDCPLLVLLWSSVGFSPGHLRSPHLRLLLSVSLHSFHF